MIAGGGGIEIAVTKIWRSRQSKNIENLKDFQEMLVCIATSKNLYDILTYKQVQVCALLSSPQRRFCMEFCKLDCLVEGLKFRVRVGETWGRERPCTRVSLKCSRLPVMASDLTVLVG